MQGVQWLTALLMGLALGLWLLLTGGCVCLCPMYAGYPPVGCLAPPGTHLVVIQEGDGEPPPGTVESADVSTGH